MKRRIATILGIVLLFVTCFSLTACGKENITVFEFKEGTKQALKLNSSSVINIKTDGENKQKIIVTVTDDTVIESTQIEPGKIRIKAKGLGVASLLATYNDKTAKMEITVMASIDEFGTGTQEDPYLIYDKYQLLDMNESQDGYENKHFKLMNNIEFKDYEWRKPIADIKDLANEEELGFRGVFDGNYKTINLNKTRNVSLFGGNFGEICNLNTTGNLILKTNEDQNMSQFGEGVHFAVGILARINYGKIDKVITSGFITNEYHTTAFGGIVGKNSGSISNAISAVKISLYSNEGSNWTGGIAGLTYADKNSNIISIKNCLFLGSILYKQTQNTPCEGGILGVREHQSQILENCHYDLTAIDARTEKEKELYDFPTRALGSNGLGLPIPEDNIKNFSGVEDFSTLNKSEWDLNIWDFTGAKPTLKGF